MALAPWIPEVFAIFCKKSSLSFFFLVKLILLAVLLSSLLPWPWLGSQCQP